MDTPSQGSEIGNRGSEATVINSEPRVIVALDFSNPMHALALAHRLDPRECAVKVGKELFVTAGPEPVRWLVDRGFNVFLDLKFHDIPNTAASACAAAARLGVWMIDVHASGGRAMLRAARDAVDAAASGAARTPPMLIAVTVLTSLDDADLREIGHASGAKAEALQLARLARDCDLDGVVCSAHEASALRTACGPVFRLVTPGIRLAESAQDDQARIVTPEAAVRAGADFIVIGRPITQAADPLATLAEINRTLAKVKKGRA
ncbi:MAG: orotidine-5'-phosphate decarboxylase [Burkholderiales bacterium]|nr:orotidine-5'-phosphate decarboxylase [Burkholderiales bacterium]